MAEAEDILTDLSKILELLQEKTVRLSELCSNKWSQKMDAEGDKA